MQVKPALEINSQIMARYAANRLRVIRQVRYSLHNENSIDLVLFLNGIPTENDKLVYVNNVLLGKLLESNTLIQQALNNSKEQFSNSPDLDASLMDAIIDALDAHNLMSNQALSSESIRSGLKAILLGPARLYETLRASKDSRE